MVTPFYFKLFLKIDSTRSIEIRKNNYFFQKILGGISYPDELSKIYDPPDTDLDELDVLSTSPYPSLEALLDFTVLSMCDHSIYDMGSFGFWSSSLAGGTTILADGYYQMPHPLLKAIKEQMPTNWDLINVKELSANSNY